MNHETAVSNAKDIADRVLGSRGTRKRQSGPGFHRMR